ncbi:MAG: DUF1846 domain-containing protein [Sphaerochaetaceae bacterium]|jgi:uncharacterized protein (UPF0371 family)|nr:DUF1846 domain-containing protein [Sphaerochaetaceae bacterium]MDD3162754.1 DUF1846 domain-containing protein [Sphaerochaetaceae bacterium]MDD4006974.1 DUF1846 domain-containing protein [Sphaerochaetaceae bacterium]MDD4396061.1 DUF1846 domain-containing protein [Sphaerochaetaceae bacterium]
MILKPTLPSMVGKIGFDNEKYLSEQRQCILQRMEQCDGKLYLECGGKLLFDMHASRVLPGFDPNVKMRVFQSFKDKLDVIICISSADIERHKIRSDFGISYDTDVFKMIDDFARWGIEVRRVVITRFSNEPGAIAFKERLERHGVKVYLHTAIAGYPNDIDRIVSDEGYGRNPYIPTDKPVVLVTAPGPGSGKLATCLGQMYHDFRAGRKSGYSKFETFPIWNLPIDHPVNVAYEAATADIGDFNMIDHFYVAAEGKIAVNYNRDLDAYPLLKRILEKITGKEAVFNSPTEMGVNRCGFGITDDEVVRWASEQEIIRRYYRSACEFAQGIGEKAAVDRCLELMNRSSLKLEDRPTVGPALEALKDAVARGKGNKGVSCSAAIQLKNGTIVTSHNSPMMHASSAMVLNALKCLAGIDEKEDLIPKQIIQSITDMKRDQLNGRGVSLNLDEMLICLAMAATLKGESKKALENLPQLRGCECHMSHVPSSGDWSGLRKIGINVTSEPVYPSSSFMNF